GRLPPSLEPLLELDANLLRSNTRAPLACEGQNLHKRNINARIHIGAQIAPSSFDNSLCVLLTIHHVSCCGSSSNLTPFSECQLYRRYEATIHLLELLARPKAIVARHLFVKGEIKSLKHGAPKMRPNQLSRQSPSLGRAPPCFLLEF